MFFQKGFRFYIVSATVVKKFEKYVEINLKE